MTSTTTIAPRNRRSQDTKIVVVWSDGIDPNDSSPLWASIRYPDSTPTLTDPRDVIVVEVSGYTQRSAIGDRRSGARGFIPRRS